MKRILTGFLVLLLLSASSVAMAQPVAQDFADVRGHWAEGEIQTVCDLGLMYGVGTDAKGNRIFQPEDMVSRAQLASVLQRTFQLDYGQVRFFKAPKASDYYQDVEDNSWYSEALVLCAVNGILNDSDSFNPDQAVNRLEVAQTIYKSFKAKNISVPMIMMMPYYEDTEGLTNEERNAVVFVSNTGIMKGDGIHFRPGDTIKRAEMARVLNQCAHLINLKQDSDNVTPPHSDSLQINIQTTKDKGDLIDLELNVPQISGLKNTDVQSAINQQFTEDAKALQANIETEVNAFKEECEKSGYPFRAYALYSGCEKYYENGQLLSLYIDYYQYTGGAHGTTERRAYNYNLQTGARLELKDLFKEGYDYKTIIDQQIKEQINAHPEFYFEGDMGFQGIGGQQFCIFNDCLVIYFSQYEIAPYAAGIPEFTIPLHIFGDNLNPQLVGGMSS